MMKLLFSVPQTSMKRPAATIILPQSMCIIVSFRVTSFTRTAKAVYSATPARKAAWYLLNTVMTTAAVSLSSSMSLTSSASGV